METKKSAKASLEKSRSSFLLIGLILATTLLIFAFNWKAQTYVDYTGGDPIGDPIDIIDIQRTNPDIPENEPEKKEIVKKVVAEIIEIVNDSTSTDGKIEPWTEDDDIEYEPVKEEDPEKIWEHTEKGAKSPLGIDGLRKFIGKNLIYPSAARENGIEGTVYLRFEVTKTGEIGKIQIFSKYVDELLIDAAKEVIKKLPRFFPAEQNGEKVNAWFSLPITFKLN